MRKLPLVGLVAAILSLPTDSRAQVSIGLRVAYGWPMGDALTVPVFGTFSQKDLFKGELPLQVDLSWRFTPNLSAGVFYSYAFPWEGTQLKSFCTSIPGASCSNLYDMRFGAQAEYAFQPNEQLDPWLAIGTGMNISHFKVKGFAISTPLGTVGGDLDGTLRGWEWFNVQVGVDYRLSTTFKLGPYVQYAVGQYTVQDIKLAGQGVATGGIPSPKTHEWLHVGLRGRFDL